MVFLQKSAEKHITLFIIVITKIRNILSAEQLICDIKSLSEKDLQNRPDKRFFIEM